MSCFLKNVFLTSYILLLTHLFDCSTVALNVDIDTFRQIDVPCPDLSTLCSLVFLVLKTRQEKGPQLILTQNTQELLTPSYKEISRKCLSTLEIQVKATKTLQLPFQCMNCQGCWTLRHLRFTLKLVEFVCLPFPPLKIYRKLKHFKKCSIRDHTATIIKIDILTLLRKCSRAASECHRCCRYLRQKLDAHKGNKALLCVYLCFSV